MIDAARLSGLWMSDPGAFPVPGPLATEGGNPREPGRRWWSLWPVTGENRRWRTALAAASVTLVATIAFQHFYPFPARESGVPASVIRPLQSALETASSIGLTVIPGGETGLTRRSSRYRSGFGESHGVLNQSIDKLEENLENDPSNREVSYWLAAAYIATGQTDLARDFTRETRSRFAQDADIATLYALVLYRDGDLAQAERELRRALTLEPDNAVAALNLGIVLMESDRTPEATDLLRRVAADHKAEPIGERAREILASHTRD